MPTIATVPSEAERRSRGISYFNKPSEKRARCFGPRGHKTARTRSFENARGFGSPRKRVPEQRQRAKSCYGEEGVRPLSPPQQVGPGLHLWRSKNPMSCLRMLSSRRPNCLASKSHATTRSVGRGKKHASLSVWNQCLLSMLRIQPTHLARHAPLQVRVSSHGRSHVQAARDTMPYRVRSSLVPLRRAPPAHATVGHDDGRLCHRRSRAWRAQGVLASTETCMVHHPCRLASDAAHPSCIPHLSLP